MYDLLLLYNWGYVKKESGQSNM